MPMIQLGQDMLRDMFGAFTPQQVSAMNSGCVCTQDLFSAPVVGQFPMQSWLRGEVVA